MKALVVYFSRTGHTKRVAERIARQLGGSTLALAERGSRLGLCGYLRSLVEGVAGLEATLESLRKLPRDYELVVIGTPIWGWHLSSPVRAFTRQQADALRRVAFFCTMGGSGDRAAFAELERLVGHRPEAVLALTEAEVAQMNQPDTRAKIDRFVDRLLPKEEGAKRGTLKKAA
jgi:menaquinone-dependent protoporphyrinogen IX oxidase